MTTDTYQDRLYLYEDDALSPADREQMDLHLAECPDCRDALWRWRAIKDNAFPEQGARAPAGFGNRVMARVAEEAPVRSAWRKMLDPVTLFGPNGRLAWAGGLALAAALVWVGPALRGPEPGAPPVPMETALANGFDLWPERDDDTIDLGTGIEEYFL